jgi:hypothetical protein
VDNERVKRSGYADLPLHGGRVPAWLASRMTLLGTAIVEAVVLHYGRAEFLTRISDPHWFQAFGSVMGMDWHSSGITTSVLGALKRGLNPRAHELGIWICGGRGRHSRHTPEELRVIADRTGLDGEDLVRSSKLTAKIDNNAVGDGFQLYLHGFVLTADGNWAVVQQGMNDTTGYARRYHWHSASVRDFLHDPHAAVVGESQGEILNLVDARAKPARAALLAISRDDPERTLKLARKHEVTARDVDLKRLGAVLAVAYDRQLHDFAELLLTEQLGPRTLQTLAQVAEVVHGAPARFSDPARYSFALGGKDRHPFPVPLKTYDETINVLRHAVDTAKLGDTEKLDGMRRLDRFVRAVEQKAQPEADFGAVMAHEHAISKSLDGRSVFDDKRKTKSRQLQLF